MISKGQGLIGGIKVCRKSKKSEKGTGGVNRGLRLTFLEPRQAGGRSASDECRRRKGRFPILKGQPKLGEGLGILVETTGKKKEKEEC